MTNIDSVRTLDSRLQAAPTLPKEATLVKDRRSSNRIDSD
jgi:hypothetical protein